MRKGSALLAALVLAALVLAAGCRSIASRRTADKVARIDAGRTTKKDVLDFLGLPNDIQRSMLADGRRVESWIYYREADQTFVIIHHQYSIHPLYSSTQIGVHRGSDRKDHAATIVFSGDVVLEVQSPFFREPTP